MRRTLAFLLPVLLFGVVPAGLARLSSGSDGWSERIEGWQVRARSRAVSAAPEPDTAGAGQEVAELAADYRGFRAAERRALAARLVDWLQARAADHYVADGSIEDWPLLDEVLRRNGDDCDGLELLSYHLLRDFGFRRVYRGILGDQGSAQHHMVTLWFEGDSSDPWVIDPTGTASPGLRRLSELEAWSPRRLFTETESHGPDDEWGPFSGRG